MESGTTALLYLNGIERLVRRLHVRMNNLTFVGGRARRGMRAIIGPNGAGRPSLMDVVTGKTRGPTTATCCFEGNPRSFEASSETQIATLSGIGRKFKEAERCSRC